MKKKSLILIGLGLVVNFLAFSFNYVNYGYFEVLLLIPPLIIFSLLLTLFFSKNASLCLFFAASCFLVSVVFSCLFLIKIGSEVEDVMWGSLYFIYSWKWQGGLLIIGNIIVWGRIRLI